MIQPKPDPNLTKAGQPRKRASGAGAPDKGRKTYLSRVTADCLADFHAIAIHIAPPGKTPSLADAIEYAAAETIKRLKKTKNGN